MSVVVVDRATLLDGGGPFGDCTLRRGDGCMCVLGFYATQQLGVEPLDLLNVGSLVDPTFGVLPRIGITGPEWLRDYREARITTVNDDPTIDDERRERTLKTLFEDWAGIDLQFVGERDPKNRAADWE